MMSNLVAIMQPYIFPYIGYMNLVSASDYFVFYDDVNFIKKGWINRNRILLSGEIYRFTIPLRNASQNSLIKDVEIENLTAFTRKFLQQIHLSYKGAKFYKETMSYIENVLEADILSIGDLAADSVIKFFRHICIEKNFIKSSENFSFTSELGREARLAEITKLLNSNFYLNVIGGTELYSKSQFNEFGIELNFVKPILRKYEQFNSKEYQAGLSIIDLMMNLSINQINKHLNSYRLL